MSRIDEMAEWQLRILSEYSKAGSPIVERWFVFWFTFLTAALGALIALSIGRPTEVGAAIGVLALLVGLIIYLEVKSKKRARYIQGALRKLAHGKPIPNEEFNCILCKLSGIEDTQ